MKIFRVLNFAIFHIFIMTYSYLLAMAESRRSSVATQRKESVASRKDSIASRKDSTSSRKGSSATDPFKDLPIVWIIGNNDRFLGTSPIILKIIVYHNNTEQSLF